MRFNNWHRTLCLLIGLVLPLLSLGSDEAGALFSKGNDYYTKARYGDAVTAYQRLINDGYESPAVYFNLGNCYYKNGDIPSALLYFEKAHKLAPGDDDINFNIRLVNSKTTDKIDEVPEFFLADWWKGFILSFSTAALSLLSIIVFLCGSVMLIIYFFSTGIGLKKLSFYAALTLFFVGLLTFFMAEQQVGYFESHRQAIVFSGSVNVKSGPGEKSATLFIIHDGAKVNILDSSNGWAKIKLANGNVGWIKQTDEKEI